MPPARRALIKATGFDVYRLVVDPGPLLSAANDEIVANFLTQITESIIDLVNVGLLVIFDVHVNGGHPVAGWSNIDLTDGIAGPKFQRLVEIERRIAAAIEAINKPTQICLELFNEPPIASKIAGDRWPTQLEYLFKAVRGAAPNVTLIVGGGGFNSVDDRWGLISLDPKAFDQNTIYSWHGYEPNQFTLQGQIGHYQYIHRLPFPPKKADKEIAIRSLIDSIEADKSLSDRESAAKIAYFTKGRHKEGLDAYFDIPQDETYIAKQIKKVTDWADNHGVYRLQLMNGEFGCNGDFRGTVAATLESRVNSFKRSESFAIKQVSVPSFCMSLTILQPEPVYPTTKLFYSHRRSFQRWAWLDSFCACSFDSKPRPCRVLRAGCSSAPELSARRRALLHVGRHNGSPGAPEYGRGLE